MTKKFKVFDIKNNRYLNEYDDVYINPNGEVYLIEERNYCYETYMYKEDITNKVRIEWES